MGAYVRLAHTPTPEKGYADLASKLGDTKGLLETGPLVDVGLEVFEFDVVPVDGHLIDVAVSTALGDELGHPIKTVGITGGARASESVTFSSARPEVLIPSIESPVNSKVGLPRFVNPGKSGSIQADEWNRIRFTYSLKPKAWVA